MQLKLLKWLEESILHRVVDKTKMGRATLTRAYPSHEEASMLKVQARQVVDYRLHVGARVKVIPGAEHEARDRVVKLLAHELMGDLIDEIYRTEEWAFTEGYDDAMLKRLRRLADLAKGERVDDV